MGGSTAHGGTIAVGLPTVMIGGEGSKRGQQRYRFDHTSSASRCQH
jgi:hypothetical protein